MMRRAPPPKRHSDCRRTYGRAHQGTDELRTFYKKAKLITEAEARYIIAHGTASSSEWVVVQYMDQWFDIRGMTKSEITDHIEDLDRKLAADLAAGIENPH